MRSSGQRESIPGIINWLLFIYSHIIYLEGRNIVPRIYKQCEYKPNFFL